MRTRVFALVGAHILLFLCLHVHGQMAHDRKEQPPTDAATNEEDEIAILEIGASTNWNLKGGAATFAPNLAAECTPIEHWLELEAGVSPFFTRNSTEWDTDFLFKKPWTISKRAEFMAGVGPQWAHLRQNGRTSDTFSGELAGDFMFWPSGRHRFGWYLEPAYDYSFAGGHPQSIGMSGGLLIGIRRRR
ncbi:hypothetical protein [Granulicella sibirica]|uniref:Outer membrane protein beta-barrel domain-containing protein n=1 Tax=Granulicella sibirica TaxID=2479048 RepID=A0A4Q0SZK6_9BACT|nr:hypothetical protein [Granulicella sibirica]RXH55470.1 hypothetical protein GRAN_2327 [Granulicella sibirica]